jgi:hypothetical protein
MKGAGSPVAVGTDECIFRDKEPAAATFELFVLNLVITGFPE